MRRSTSRCLSSRAGRSGAISPGVCELDVFTVAHAAAAREAR